VDGASVGVSYGHNGQQIISGGPLVRLCDTMLNTSATTIKAGVPGVCDHGRRQPARKAHAFACFSWLPKSCQTLCARMLAGLVDDISIPRPCFAVHRPSGLPSASAKACMM
jgi:hypothetical protein